MVCDAPGLHAHALDGGAALTLTSDLTQRDNYLVLRVAGDYSAGALTALGDMVAKATEEHDCTNVMVDMREVQGLISNMDRFVAGVYAAQLWPRPLHVAVVLQSAAMDSFFQNTAYNRGVQTLVVASEDEAKAWLGV
jgi:hypothetical protein